MMQIGNPAYGSLPPMPQINAMPHGIPQGPWGPLYRAAPGAQIPAVAYPGMRGAPVRLLGTTASQVGEYALKIATAAGLGAVIAMGVKSKKRPVLMTAAFTGAFALGTMGLDYLIQKMKEPKTPPPA